MVKKTDGKLYLRLFDWQHNTHTDQSIISVPIAKWFQVEAYYKQSATSQGEIIVWQDGVEVFHKTGINTMFTDSTDRAAEWSVNNYSENLTPPTTTIYTDDMAVSTTRIGAGTLTPTILPTNIPTITPTKLPSITLTKIPTATPTISHVACESKKIGDADCNTIINLTDFEIWRKEFFVRCNQIDILICAPDEDRDGKFMDADFNNLPEATYNNINGVSISDFEVWRMSFFNK